MARPRLYGTHSILRGTMVHITLYTFRTMEQQWPNKYDASAAVCDTQEPAKRAVLLSSGHSLIYILGGKFLACTSGLCAAFCIYEA